MPLITDSITYNVNQRGRKHRGVDRHFDCAALAAMVNGPAVQERVKAGDMVGYYGHWPRLKLGMQPAEGGIVDGAVVHVDPALRTIELQANPDGTITHRTEFLDTASGEIAQSLFKAGQGGFSSAIDAIPRTMPAIPRMFGGFDYVLEPNYNTNRGTVRMLDGVTDAQAALMDSVLMQAAEADAALAQMFDSLQDQFEQAQQTIRHLSELNEGYLARLASRKASQVLDSAVGAGFVLPRREPAGDLEAMRAFRTASLVKMQALPKDPGQQDTTSPEARMMARRYGIR